ncbi:MAG: MoxR family ATPase [Verrucomicrobiales bacterium]|nr:MoxR family ATPase [Verrucomicrobiales bacterium]HQZ28423.1 MoxR family ATPase [Verrucomicrobiales bacterium]
MRSSNEFGEDLERFRETFQALKTEIQKAIVGYDDLLTDTLVAVFARGHVLLEGVPGLGKTFLVQTLSKVLGLTPGRIQCTPDLMPADILGTHIVNENDEGRRVMHFEKGPVFANLILVDEVNRATPKTQAALLEVMQEGGVTAGGETMPLPKPFFVMATQNPMEMEGTYPLPEAQADRFLFKLRVPFPDRATLIEISRRTSSFDLPELSQVISGEELMDFQKIVAEVPVADHVNEFAARIVLATHPGDEGETPAVARYVSYGASPRGMQALIRGARIHCVLDGRTAVSLDDVKRVALPALRHRVILNFQGEAESRNVDILVQEVIDAVSAEVAV